MAFLDPFRRAFGVPTPEEVEKARQDRREIEASPLPQDVFARTVADRVQDMSHGQASHVLHGLTDREWPTDPDVRWHHSAMTARHLADETVSRPVANMDRALGEATARRALVETSMIIDASGPAENADKILSGSIDAVRDDVLAFMSHGKAAEHNASEQARAILSLPGTEGRERLLRDVGEFLPAPAREDDQSAWTLKAARIRLAMAQGGLLPADRTVEAAVEVGQTGDMQQGPLAAYDRRMAEQGDHKMRLAILAEAQERTLVSAYGREGPALDAARREVSLAPPPRPEPTQLTETEQKAHARHLMEEALRRSQAVDRPRAVLTGGQPGSGKSYIVSSVGVEFEGMGGVIKIDPDEIRPTLPYMAERIAAGDLEVPNAANIDAGTIAYQMVQIAKENRRNVIIDGTLQNTARALDLAGEMRSAKYHVEFHGMATYPDLSHARTYSRREEQIAQSPTGFGRGVGDEFHHQAVKGFGLTVETFQKKASVDSMTLHFGENGRPVSTRFVNGSWVPALDMKETLDRVHEQPSQDVLKRASDTWAAASKAMKARDADPAEIVKIDGLRNAALDREEAAQKSTKNPDRARIAQLQAMQRIGQGR